ncbi:MAG: hypothetical protein PVI46_09670 [Lysobacterales bacterium]
MILSRVIEHVKKQHWPAVFVELLIVILGVFIGLQVDNWNTARAEHTRARVYLQQLLIDLDSDVAVGERGVAFSNTIDDAAETLLSVWEGDARASAISDADLIAAVPMAGYAFLPYGNRATYDEMISTGGLGLLDNAELKRALAEYYFWQAAGRQWDDLVRDEQYAYRAAIRGILTRKQFAWARANTIKKPTERAPLPEFDRGEFLERAGARPEIIDSLSSMGAMQERLRDDSRNRSQRAESLAERIKEELAEK